MPREPGDAALRRAEEILSGAPFVARAVVVRAGDPPGPWAVAWPDEEELRRERFANLYENLRFRLENAATALPPAGRPRGWTIARAPLPVTPAGEPDRERLARELGSRPGRCWPADPPGRDPLPREWEALFRSCDRVPPGANLWRETSLEFDLGLDSLDRAAFVLSLGQHLGIEMGEEDLAAARTLGDLVELLSGRGVVPPPVPDRWPVRPEAVLEGPVDGAAGMARRLSRPHRLGWPLVLACLSVGRAVARRKLDLRAEGLERVRWGRRPLIVAQNHQSNIDPFLLGGVLPRNVLRDAFFVGFTGYFGRGAGRLPSLLFRVQPISADPGLLPGIRAALAGLRAGRVLCIYPEGERTWRGDLQPFRRGVAWLARASGAHVVPSAIVGAYRAWPRGWPFVPHPVRILFGPEIPPPGPGESDGEFLARLRTAIAGLLREGGADPRRGDPETWAHGPAAVRRRSVAREGGSR